MSRHFTLQEVNDLELSAVEAERERIVRLLENELSFDDDDISVLRDAIINSLIKLIEWSHPEQDFGKPEGKEIL